MPHSKTRGGRKARRSRPAPPLAVSPAALRLAVPALVVLFSAFAWLVRGMHADGFIYLRVVDVFLRGGGLAYNPGERFETNTDFLWSLLLIPGPAAGVDDVLWLQLLGVAVYAAALWGFFALARRALSGDAALAALVLLGTHYSFTHFAATGFGTVLQALAAVCALLGLWRFGENPSAKNGAMLGAGISFLALCRLDSVVLGAPIVLCALFFARRGGKNALPGIVLGLGIPAIVSALLLAWKWFYYGDIFPATYYAKAASDQGGVNETAFRMRQGAEYVLLYWKRYFLWALSAAAVLGFWKMSGGKSKVNTRAALMWTIGGMCAMWNLYMLRTGGDYLEFRLLVPQAPLLMILLAAGLSGLPRTWMGVAVAGGVLASVVHWQTETGLYIKDGNVVVAEKVIYATQLVSDANGTRTRLTPSAEDVVVDYYNMGLGIRDLFGHLGDYPPEVRVAHLDAGIVPYLSRLLWTEMYGWTDSRVARAGAEDVYYDPNMHLSGHRTRARPRLLARLGVNLVFPTAAFYTPGKGAAVFNRPIAGADNPRLVWAAHVAYLAQAPNLRFPPDSQLFEMSLPNGKFIPVLYFNRNATIDRVLDERGIERVDVFQ